MKPGLNLHWESSNSMLPHWMEVPSYAKQAVTKLAYPHTCLSKTVHLHPLISPMALIISPCILPSIEPHRITWTKIIELDKRIFSYDCFCKLDLDLVKLCILFLRFLICVFEEIIKDSGFLNIIICSNLSSLLIS